MKSIHVNANYQSDEQKFFEGTVSKAGRQMNIAKDGEKKESRKSVFAGDMNLSFQDRLGQKKAKAQKDALKRIIDVFENDLKLDQTLKNSALHKDELLEQVKQYDAEIERLNQSQQELKEEYGITDDSQEEQDLNLIRKSLSDPLSITEEEMTHLEEIGPITDYQRTSLEYDAMKDVWTKLKDDAIAAHKGESQKIEGIKLSRLKSDPMAGAQKEAQEIKDAATDSIIAMIREDAKDNIDEKFGVAAEDDKKTEEEEDDKKDKTEEAKADIVAEDITADQKDVLERIKKFIQTQGILQEDALGIKIDELL